MDLERYFTEGEQVAVMIPSAMGSPYDYLVPAGMSLRPGMCVHVPLARRQVMGVVWGAGLGQVPLEKMKPIDSVLDGTPLLPPFRRFIDFMAGYTASDPGAVLKLAFPGGKVGSGSSGEKKERKGGKPIGGKHMNPDHVGVALNPAQERAAHTLRDMVSRRTYQTILLDGVTGAGKTEVYFEAVAEALRLQRQVLILHPEIALTSGFATRFAERFGDVPALWHSHLTPAQRRKTYQGIVSGDIRVVAGARSALMLPYPNLGLIVVDEEHDPSYKQEDGVIYHARDMAVARAGFEGAGVILASATPSAETIVNVQTGKYSHVTLPARYGAASMPQMHVIDMRQDGPEKGTFISPPLLKAMEQARAGGEQVLLFLNRRGYAPLTLCRTCGHRFMCPKCTSWMVLHKRPMHMMCHHCGYKMPAPQACPACGDTESLVPCGPGVERIEDEVKKNFPDARTLVLSSDGTQNADDLRTALSRIENREVDVIIGTQLIAKGHHFPYITTVGVIDADLGLGGGDLRAAERTFQLLQQVAGRAGRAHLKGHVYLQTYAPDHPVIKALSNGDRDMFMATEIEGRRLSSMPPFARLAAIIISSQNEDLVGKFVKDIARTAPHAGAGDEHLVTWGPAPAPLYRLRGQYRHRFLIQASRKIDLPKVIDAWLSSCSVPRQVDVRVDIDPQSFL